ncbi:MAG TPA: DNA repair protein RecN [Vicinamibacteria bacterium]|nr:DNA repair protein RecN [Vicinamibacteria bacterium]
MIKWLRISNIALIRHVELELGPGLTLLTGETGAGKSILVDALGLLLGRRASPELIRSGEEQASVEGLLERPEARGFLEAHGLPAGEELVIRREVQASGKGRATVNGALVPLVLLRELGAQLVTIHGQHEPQGLLDPETHVQTLDRHAGVSATAEVAPLFARLREVDAELESLRRDRREWERRREMLEFQAREIEAARLLPGEEETLHQEKAVQANAGRLATLAEEAYALLYEEEGAALARLKQVYRRVEELAGIDARFESHRGARDGVVAPLEDLAYFLRDYKDGLQVNPGRLDEIESRLALVERLKRKYGATVEDIVAFGARCRADLEASGSAEDRERDLVGARGEMARRYFAAALELSKKRRAAAKDLQRRVEAELAQLAMERTRFRVQFDPDVSPADPGDSSSWSALGLETAEFLLSPNPGEELRPLARIASGGELSRILLALNAASGLEAPGQSLVFDEVDAGIGGRVAEVVGRKLKAIAGRHQVLCVTHLPQIASLADSHLVASKRTDHGRTIAEVRPLSGEERIEEVARMLGGETITDTARRHAREMVKQALRA